MKTNVMVHQNLFLQVHTLVHNKVNQICNKFQKNLTLRESIRLTTKPIVKQLMGFKQEKIKMISHRTIRFMKNPKQFYQIHKLLKS